MSHALEAYGYFGIGTFGLLLLYRFVKWLFGASIFPDVSDVDMVLVKSTKLNALALLLGACLIAWPLVVFEFFTVPRDKP